jgi:hypothetical protein
MQKKSIKICLVALLLSVTVPAEAQAPVPSKKVIAEAHPKLYARSVMQNMGWYEQQYVCLAKLWGKESHWNHKADNPKSTAFGIAQMLNEKSTSPVTQIDNGLRYIKFRYGQPCAAWEYWQRHNWY